MAWNQPTTNSENQNKESEKEKMPKSVKFANLCCGLLSVLGLLLGVGSYLFTEPYGYNPWTVGVGCFTWCIVASKCAVMISRRNMIAAVFAIIVQFVVGWVFFGHIFSMVVSGVPMLLLLLPQSRRWLKVNSHFSTIGAIVYILIVGVGVIISKSSVVTEKYIANKNPIWVFKPGDMPIHPFNEPNAHVYDYWRTDGLEGYYMGDCIVKYNRHNVCSEVVLGIRNVFASKDPADYNYYQQKLKDECERRFGHIEWTVSEAYTGFPRLYGKTSNRITIEIYCPDIDSVYCILAVYDPQLLDNKADYDHNEDDPSEQPKTRSIQNNPLSNDYGNPDRKKLFHAPFRGGLGVY